MILDVNFKFRLQQEHAIYAKHKLNKIDGSESEAVFSNDDKHRFWLAHRWDEELATIAYIGLNPSTADESKADPTVTRCIRRAEIYGYGSMIMLNAFSLRSTDPFGLGRVDKPNEDANDEWIKHGAETADVICCCWGTHIWRKNRQEELRKLLLPWMQKVSVLALTKEGHPKHPLYVSYATEFKKWEMA